MVDTENLQDTEKLYKRIVVNFNFTETSDLEKWGVFVNE